MDLVEGEGSVVTPVDYKRGKRPHVARGAYDPERVQLCVQGLILEEHGYRCEQGILYFAESRERVPVRFDEELRALTHNAISGLRFIAAGGQTPLPLEDSPKCPRCSLVGICLPDEVNFIRDEKIAPRPLAVARDDALPLYIQARGAKLSKKGETLEVSIDDQKIQTVRLIDVSQVIVMGNVYITTPTLQELMQREIPVSWHSYGGWFIGHTVGTGHKNVEIRTAQYRASFDERLCAHLARNLVAAKIHNCRTLLRRNWKGDDTPDALLDALQADIKRTRRYRDIQELLGTEGSAAARYFGSFGKLLREGENDGPIGFDFTSRNRRQPQPSPAYRSGQCPALLRLHPAGTRLEHDTVGGRLRPVSRLLPPTALRPPGAGTRHDGAFPAADRRLLRDPGDQQRRGETERFHPRRW